MRFGTSLAEPTGPQALSALRDGLRQAADDGFASAWMANIFGLEALTALAVAGHGVGGIEVGTAVVPTYPRHPAVLAQQALTTALALDGRLTLGIGLSHKIVIEDMYGYGFDAPAVHMSEYLSVLLPLLEGQPVAFTGSTLRASIGLSVPRAGEVPVMLAAMGPQMLKLAGQRTAGTILWMTGPATVRDYIAPTINAAAQERQARTAGGVHPAGLRDRRPRPRPRQGREGLRDLRPASLVPGHARPRGRRRTRRRRDRRRRGRRGRPDHGAGRLRRHRLRGRRVRQGRGERPHPRTIENSNH